MGREGLPRWSLHTVVTSLQTLCTASTAGVDISVLDSGPGRSADKVLETSPNFEPSEYGGMYIGSPRH